MIQAVIFDLNGIFIESPKLSERFHSDFHIPASIFLPKLSEIMEKVRRPNAGGAFTYWKPVLEEWRVSFTEEEFWNYWFGAEKVSEQMVLFAKELRGRGILVFILSNNFKERAEYYGHYPWITDGADKTYFSWQSGFVKPDTRAWLHILEENNLKSEECLYFDDQEKNVKAAESIGIVSFLWKGQEELEKTIKKFIFNPSK